MTRRLFADHRFSLGRDFTMAFSFLLKPALERLDARLWRRPPINSENVSRIVGMAFVGKGRIDPAGILRGAWESRRWFRTGCQQNGEYRIRHFPHWRGSKKPRIPLQPPHGFSWIERQKDLSRPFGKLNSDFH